MRCALLFVAVLISSAQSQKILDPLPPTDVVAVQDGPTSILVSWTLSSYATGYSIYYIDTSGGDNRSVTIGSASNNSYILTGLLNGNTYSVSIAATVDDISSERVTAEAVGLVPGAPTIKIVKVTTTLVTVSGRVPRGSVLTGCMLQWERRTTDGCLDEGEGSSQMEFDWTSYLVQNSDLEGNSAYNFTMRAFNRAGVSAVSNVVNTTTKEAAPSGYPTSITSSTITTTSITVWWSEVLCLDRNGIINGYIIRVSREEIEHRVLDVGDVREATITGLAPSTEYTVQVAAVNNISSGPYSRGAVYTTKDILIVSGTPLSSTSLNISWTLEPSFTATGYIISYSNTNPGCFSDTRSGIYTWRTSYELTGLQEATEYSVNVTVTLSWSGRTEQFSTEATTMFAVPSAPPSYVSLSVNSSTAVTVQWGLVDCIHQNGEITGYWVRYGKVGSEDTQALFVSRGSVTQSTLSSLLPSTNYYVQVAGVNSAGTGVYSNFIFETPTNVYLSLNGDVIPNHGYVIISDIGSTGDTALLCNTNRPPQGLSGGDWFGSDGDRVDSTDVPGFWRNRGPMVVRLLRNTAIEAVEGIYKCVIQDKAHMTCIIYVGLYSDKGGIISIPNNIEMSEYSDLNGASPQFTLTCISTGGPATTVQWTRDSTPVAEGTTGTVLNNRVTAQYTHTLTVSGRLPGLYTCTVANSAPSNDSAIITLKAASAPTYFMAVFKDPDNSVLLTWTPPSPPGDTTGYRIHYTTGGGGSNSSGSVNITDAHTNSYTLAGLALGSIYDISIVALSEHFSGEIQTIKVILKAPSESSTVVAPVATSISLSWSGWSSDDSSLTDADYTVEDFNTTSIHRIYVKVTGTNSDLLISVSTVANETTCSQHNLIPITTAAATTEMPYSCGSEQFIERKCPEIEWTPVIIGGAVGAVVLSISIAINVIVVLILFSKCCRRSPADPKTSRNEAYGRVKHTGEPDGVYEVIPLRVRSPLPLPQPALGHSHNQYK